MERPHTFAEEERLFTEAIGLGVAERAVFLAEVRRKDAVLCSRVEGLLREHERVQILDEPARVMADECTGGLRNESQPAEQAGTVIGRYVLLEKLGEGGWGTVFRAEQSEPVRREVALKIIKLGMDTQAVVARFEAERQALALMSHPHIARVFDGGVTATGRPYFVMERVAGVRITTYCDEQRLTIEQRLRLFVLVCDAVQHAHQKGIIHRDLKPANILVTEAEGRAAPKIIDFGIAKALHGRLTENTLVTGVDQLVGTPAYMSPEQAGGGAGDVDTRSDVYSLGVLLYELLAGSTPVDSNSWRSLSPEDVRRIIRDVDPPRPSARIAALPTETQAGCAERRKTDGPKLIRRLRGDLDWVAMQCLEKDRSRRYETASALAQDVQRHLDNQPVTARPASSAYLASKFVRRHRAGFAAGVVVAVVLMGAAAISTGLYLRERTALRRALVAEHTQSALRERAEAGEKAAQKEATRSAQVAQFMRDMIASVNLRVAQGKDTRLLRELLDRTAERLDRELKEQPEVEADLRATLGTAYANLGEYSRLEATQRKTLALCEKVYGRDHVKTLEAFEDLGRAVFYLGRDIEADQIYREALAWRRRIAPAEDIPMATAVYRVGLGLGRLRKYTEAEAALREALRMQENLGPPDNIYYLDVLKQIAHVYMQSGRWPEAEATYRDVVARHPRETTSYSVLESKQQAFQDLGRLLLQLQKLDEAEFYLKQSVELHKVLYAGDATNPRAYTRVTEGLRYLGTLYLRQNRWSEAESTLREVLDRSRHELAADVASITLRQRLAHSLLNVAELLQHLQRYGEAEALAREAVELQANVRPALDNRHAEALMRLGHTLRLQERWEEAATAYRQAFPAILKGRLSQQGYGIAAGWLVACERLGKAHEATAAAATMLDTCRAAERAHGLAESGILAAEATQALLVHRQLVAGAPFAREMLHRWEAHDASAWQTFVFRTLVGYALATEGKRAEAEPYLREGYAGLQRLASRVPSTSADFRSFALRALEELLNETNRPEDAAALRSGHNTHQAEKK